MMPQSFNLNLRPHPNFGLGKAALDSEPESESEAMTRSGGALGQDRARCFNLYPDHSRVFFKSRSIRLGGYY
jgi:hypothetical protein